MKEPEATYDVVVTRIFEAPVDEVWDAWRDPDRVKHWWGPHGFTCPLAAMDFREGGTSLVCMRAPAEHGGMDIYSTWTYTTITPHDTIEYIFRFADKDGRAIRPAQAGIPAGVPDAGHHVIQFRRLDGGRTEMTMTEHGYTTREARDMSRAGLDQTLDKLAHSLK
jgi:uncharacterized protein YndB with AHSA1/START domain